jgi:hypothetical protein
MKREAKVKNKVGEGKRRRHGDDSDQRPKIDDAFSCYLCGFTKFESQFDATVHEISCDGKQNPFGPWKCSTCGKVFAVGRGFGSHRIICHQGAMKGTSLSLRPPCMEEFRARLSDYNALVTESIELVEVTRDDIEKFAKKLQRKRTPQVGNVGIRCVYCVANGSQPPGSMSCPQNLRSLPHNIYNMVQRHLLLSCPYVPKQIKNQLELAKENSTSQSGQKERIGLPLYLTKLVNEFGLTDIGQNEGVQRSSVTGKL